jgi:fructosamine-3-kinase
MPNTWESSWAEFFGKNRLQAILEEDRRTNGRDAEIEQLGKECVESVVPRLLGALESGGKSIKPVLVHGDLSAFPNFSRLTVDGVEMQERILIPGNPLFMIPVHSTRTTNTRLEFKRFSPARRGF